MVKNTLFLKWPILSQSLNRFKFLTVLLTLFSALAVSSCSKLGYGVLLWSVDDPPIDSGTVLPVYIKSNIQKLWVVGVPDAKGRDENKIEIPLTQLEFVGSKRKAEKRAYEFSRHAMTYAENLQDRLPIRDNTDNNARQIYRLRLGEIIKILEVAKGIPPISTTGDPLPGDWYKVMTSDGVVGYCFSYRLRIFNQNEESVKPSQTAQKAAPDPELERLLSKTWSAESYLQMFNSGRYNIHEMERNYRFDPGYETGQARIILSDLEKTFSYEKISRDGENSWTFDGTSLYMSLRSGTSLSVQFTDNNGMKRTLSFVSLPSKMEDVIVQETARRENQYKTIYNQGPSFTSSNYGTITLLQTGDLQWTGFDLLVPQVIPLSATGNARIYMDLYISQSYEERYNGAFTMKFTDVRQNGNVYFMYNIDNQGLRLEVVPDFGIEDVTVVRRSASPFTLYFFRDSPQ